MPITKTDYLEYAFCRKNLWLKKHKPELFEGVEFSDFEKKIIEEGNAADEAARSLFPQGVLIESHQLKAVQETKKALEQGTEVLFQAAFAVDDFYIRADIIVRNQAGGWALYEVKATNSVKPKGPLSHVQDLAFQKKVIQRAGLEIADTGVIHLNKEYKKDGEIDYHRLFVTEEISEQVRKVEAEVEARMEEMQRHLAMPEQKGCDCIYKGRSSQCTSFAYSNPDLPEYSVHDLYRIGNSKKKLTSWIDERRFLLKEVAEEELNDRQRLQIEAELRGEPIIDKQAIKELLDEVEFPLYFFDYEGLASAVPLFDGFGPYEHVPFQYSAHIMHEDGEMEHKEFLIMEMSQDITKPLVEQLVKDIGTKGTVVSWYASYERQRNNKLIELHPHHAAFLNEINDQMFDLEKIFSKGLYVDPAFKGKTSIKKVLPVLIPELSYDELGIQKGDQASERWEHMLSEETGDSEKAQIAADLLEYCKMDTWAMVEIYRALKRL